MTVAPPQVGARAPPYRLFELRDLDVLMMVRETGSFRAAAHALGVQPSAVSRRVAALKDRLGVSLFERRRSGARPTDAGRLFQDEIRSVLARLDTAVRYVQTAGRAGNGRLDIGVMASLSSRFFSRLIRTGIDPVGGHPEAISRGASDAEDLPTIFA